ncbi:MAG: hypothetical protein AAF492_20730 [Verrucomicrobiota bacterium]
MTGTAAMALVSLPHLGSAQVAPYTLAFNQPDSLVHGPEWESLNPGFWQIKGGALRRRIKNYGDRARSTGFPYHYETHGKNSGVMNTEYDPSLPPGVIYHRQWRLTGAWSLTARFVYHGQVDVRREGDADTWKMYQNGYGMMGLAFGAESLFESYGRIRQASLIGWTDDGLFGFVKQPKQKQRDAKPRARKVKAPPDQAGGYGRDPTGG